MSAVDLAHPKPVPGSYTPPLSPVDRTSSSRPPSISLSSDDTPSTESLLSQLAALRTQNAELQSSSETQADLLAFARREVDALRGELEAERAARQDAEEHVGDLRARLEDSRRGFMRLQMQQEEEMKRRAEGENRRTSMILPVGLGLDVGDGVLSKRNTIGGRSHRRISSISNPDESVSTTTKSKPGLRELRLSLGAPSHSLHPASSAIPERRVVSARTSPDPSAHRSSSPTRSLSPAPSIASDVGLASLRAELLDLRTKLAESEERLEASETCLNALREFMDANGGQKPEGLKLPPLPTAAEAESQEVLAEQPQPAKPAPARGWLAGWRKDSTASASSSADSAQAPPPPPKDAPTSSPQPTSSTTATPSASPNPGASSIGAPTALRSLSSFFSKSSTHTTFAAEAPASPEPSLSVGTSSPEPTPLPSPPFRSLEHASLSRRPPSDVDLDVAAAAADAKAASTPRMDGFVPPAFD